MAIVAIVVHSQNDSIQVFGCHEGADHRLPDGFVAVEIPSEPSDSQVAAVEIAFAEARAFAMRTSGVVFVAEPAKEICSVATIDRDPA